MDVGTTRPMTCIDLDSMNSVLTGTIARGSVRSRGLWVSGDRTRQTLRHTLQIAWPVAHLLVHEAALIELVQLRRVIGHLNQRPAGDLPGPGNYLDRQTTG